MTRSLITSTLQLQRQHRETETITSIVKKIPICRTPKHQPPKNKCKSHQSKSMWWSMRLKTEEKGSWLHFYWSWRCTKAPGLLECPWIQFLRQFPTIMRWSSSQWIWSQSTGRSKLINTRTRRSLTEISGWSLPIAMPSIVKILYTTPLQKISRVTMKFSMGSIREILRNLPTIIRIRREWTSSRKLKFQFKSILRKRENKRKDLPSRERQASRSVKQLSQQPKIQLNSLRQPESSWPSSRESVYSVRFRSWIRVVFKSYAS